MDSGLDACSEDAATAYDRELQADAGLRLKRAVLQMERFLRRDECCRRGSSDPSSRLGRRLAEEARGLLQGALEACAPAPAVPAPDAPTTGGPAARGPAVCESTLRSAYRLTGALANLAAWTAPATQESSALNSFPAAASRDVVAYARYGCPEISAQEFAYASMLGFDAAARLLLTSSGMAAYALIENFLLRDVVTPGDRVLLHPGVYFETQVQVKALKFLDVITACGGARTDIIQSIAAIQPKVVFVDPLTNSMDFRAIDMVRLLDEAERVCDGETWFVVDGTLLSGGFDPFAARHRRHVRVLYYESGCKYLQFGMDLGPAGIVVVETRLAERLLQLRRGTGAIASEALVLPRASRAAYLDYLCAQTACALAIAKTVNEYSGGDGRCGAFIEAAHPLLASHPDCAEVQGYCHMGGVLVFRFKRDSLNRREPLEAFIDALMTKAVAQDLPLTVGVSFGFRVPRIGAAWSSYDADRAFLRLSAGVSLHRAVDLGRLIGECAEELAAADLEIA